jgi:hypothetical protein
LAVAALIVEELKHYSGKNSRSQRNRFSDLIQKPDVVYLKTTITNMLRSQIKTLLLASLLAVSITACNAAEPGQDIAPGVRLLGYIRDPRIKESSGVIASRQYGDVFWTHNDGGGPKKQVLYAIDREGNTRAFFSVIDVTLHDWEDIAIDDAGHLYIGDTGNNDAKRDTLAVYEIDEPNPQAGTGSIAPKRVWKLKFPETPFDCEGLFVWKDQGYVVSKVFDKEHARIFRFPLKETNEPLTLELVATTKIESPVTGADISADGTLLGLVAKNGAYVFRINGDVTRVSNTNPHHTKLKNEHIEGCCFVRQGLLATSERRMIFLFTDPTFRRH